MRMNYLKALSLAIVLSATTIPVMAGTVYAKETDTEDVIVEEPTLFLAQTGKYSGAFEYNDDGTVTQIQEGIMPSIGNVDALVFMVDFPDVNHNSTHTKEYVEDVFFGRREYSNGNVFEGTVTLADYYDTSSYGQLQIGGQVYGWYTAEHERNYYARADLEYPMAENLFWEVIDAFDDTIDYSRYDKDNDGYVDSVYIVYAGGNEGWGSVFWTYVDQTISNQEKDGKKIAQYGFINENDLNGRAIEHETGHMLGLIDYYDYEKQQFGSSQQFGGSETLMLDNQGDLDMWSKILLGWVQPAKITSDAAFSLRTGNKYGDAAIVYPKQADTNSFFVIEYTHIERVTIYGLKSDDRVRIYRINYTSGNAGGFKYGVTDENELKTIELIYDSTDDNTGGISPYCNPASYVVVENTDGTLTREFTGITIKQDEINEQGVKFTVNYENLDVNKKPSYTMETKLANNKVYIELVFDIEMYENGEAPSIEAVGGGQRVPLKLGHNQEYEYYLYSDDNQLLPDTTYSFTIPEGCLVSYYGAGNERITGSFTTDNYSTVTENNINSSGAISTGNSEIIALTGEKYGYFTVNNGKLYLYEYSSDGFAGSRELAAASTEKDIKVHACKLENGEFVIAVLSNNSVVDCYRMYADDTCELVNEGLYINDGILSILAIGNNALISVCNSRGAYLLKTDNSVEYKADLCNLNHVSPYQDINILWGDITSEIVLVDNEVNIIRKILFYGGAVVLDGVIDNNGIITVFGCRNDATPFIKYYSSDCELIGEETADEVYREIYPCKNGFIATKEYDIPYYNENGEGYFSGWMYSPIAIVSVYDLNFEKQFSYTFDYNKMGAGDSVKSIIQLENGDVVASTSWCSYYFTDFEIEEVQIKHRVHEFSEKWTFDNSNHWHICTAADCDGTISGKAAHIAGDWIVDKAATTEEVGSRHKECTVCSYVMVTEAIPRLVQSTNAVITDAGLYLLENTREHIVIGVVASTSEPTDIEYRWSAKDSSGNTQLIQDWTLNNEWLNWTPETYGEYTLIAEARVAGNPVSSKTVQEVVYFNPHIKGKCQLPYAMVAPGQPGYLIGVETYENPEQSYQYEMLILDCTLLAEGKDAWVYTTGKFTVTEGAAGWCVWQPKYGYYWTLFRVYDAEGNMIDQACYPFVNAY